MAIIKPEQLQSGSYSISGSFSGSFQGDGSKLTGITASFIPPGVGGIYGGNGTVPLNTTASINGDLTFQGLDEDTRLIVRDGNNGGQVHLFSDGASGQSALEYYNPAGTSLFHKIQIAGGDTRYQSNQRDLVFSTSTGSFSSGIFITSSNGNVGIGTVTPNYKLDVNGTTNINGNTTITGSVNISGSLIASGLSYPTIDQEQGDVLTTDGTGNLTFEKPTIYAKVKNISGGTLPKGLPVHVISSVGNTDEVIAASASNASTMPATFVLAQQLDDEEEGLGIVSGFINGVNTTGFGEGDIVYVGANGGYTNQKPTGSNLIQNLGIVTKIGTNGSGFVYGAGRANDIPNIQPGYVWVGNSDWVATPTPTSSIQNVVSASYALTASYALSSAGGGSNTGIFGIADASGSYTYYSDFQTAINAASAGETVQMFTDVTETTDTTVNMKNGVNVNFNGHTYTLNTSGTSNCISVGTGVTVELFNGKIVRTGGVASFSTSLCMSVGTGGLLRNFDMYYYNDFGTAIYCASSGLRMIGGDCLGETIGCYVNNATVENVNARANTQSGIQIQNGGVLYYSNGYSRDFYGIYNNNSTAYSCVGRSDGSFGFQAGGNNHNCEGYSSANIGMNCTGNFSNIYGFSGASHGVNVLADGNGVSGYSTAGIGVRMVSGGGASYKVGNLNAHSTAAIALYLFLNAGKFEISNINVFTDWNDSNGHGVQVLGTDNDIYISGGNINVLNSSANCLYNNTAKSFYFANLSFMNATTPINANITNLQSNTPDAYGNILIG